MSKVDDPIIVRHDVTSFFQHPEYLVDLNALAQELRADARTIKKDDLKERLNSPDMALFIALMNARVVGMATLHILRNPLFTQGIVHNVVVSNAARGKGVGAKLMEAITELARSEALDYIDLTSRRERTAAHKLYEKLGFKIRDTRVYRLDLSQVDKP